MDRKIKQPKADFLWKNKLPYLKIHTNGAAFLIDPTESAGHKISALWCSKLAWTVWQTITFSYHNVLAALTTMERVTSVDGFFQTIAWSKVCIFGSGQEQVSDYAACDVNFATSVLHETVAVTFQSQANQIRFSSQTSNELTTGMRIDTHLLRVVVIDPTIGWLISTLYIE